MNWKIVIDQEELPVQEGGMMSKIIGYLLIIVALSCLVVPIIYVSGWKILIAAIAILLIVGGILFTGIWLVERE